MARSLPFVQPGRPEAGPPIFERIAIVGLGLIGGSLALACRRAWPSSLVIGVDRNEVIEQAIARHAIDVAADDLGMLREAQLIVLAAPVLQNISLVSRLPDCVAVDAIVTDVGSTKRAIVEAARDLPARLRFIGGHPLAGAARSGIDHASADIFAGRPWILTPASSSTGRCPEAREERVEGAPTLNGRRSEELTGEMGDDPALASLAAWVRALGADPRVMTPEAHDHLVAFLSHLPQLAASALMRVVGEAAGQEHLGLAGRGLADTTRLASSPASVWADICASNADEIGQALDALIAHLSELRAGLDDPDVIARVFDEAAAWRRHLANI